MFCRYCGARVPDGAKFCSSCGKQLASQAARPASPNQASQNPQAQEKPVQNSPYQEKPLQNTSYSDKSKASAPYPERNWQDSSFQDRGGQNPSYPNRPMQDSYPNRDSQNQPFSSQQGGFTPPSLDSVAGKLQGILGNLTENLGKPRPKVQGGPRVKVKKKFNIGNYVCWGGCALAAASLFLPYVSVSMLGFSEDTTLIDTEDGSFFLAILLVIAVVNLLRLNIGTVVLSVFHLYLVYMEHDNVTSSFVGSLTEFGMGHTLQLLGAFVMLAASVAGLVLWTKYKRSARM